LAAASFSATLDRDTITVGESATLSLTFEGGTPDALPAFPNIPNLQIAASGSSTQFTLNNGQSSSSVIHTFRLVPRQAGDFTIPSLAVDIGGQKISSQPLTLKVLNASAPPPEAINSGSQLAFVKLVLPKREVYVGESFTAQFHFYFHSRVQNISQPQPAGSPIDGFNVLQIGQIGQGQRRVQVGNAIYTVFPVNVIFRAVKAGPLTIGPVAFNIVLELPSPNRQRDPFDPFGMFNRNEQKQVVLATEPESVKSLPLPRENVPPGFNGAVGSYTMSLTAGPTNVAVGDPITVKIQIAGRGSLDSLNLPEQPAWGDFKTYPPTTKIEPPNALLQGTKVFEQIVTPQSADIKALPAVSFSFFDPEQKTYRTLTQPAVPLTIRPGGSTPAPSVAGVARPGQDPAPLTQDIVPNKQRLGTLARIGPPLALQGWFLAAQSIPALAFVSAVLWRRQTERLANNPRLRRHRQVAQIIRDGLVQLRQCAGRNQGDEFFATLFRLMQEQLGERLDLPATAITEAVIDERLRPRGVPEKILAPLQELFQTCNLARYAPVKSSEELAAIIPRFEAALRQVRELKL
jgi:hypothetical protein